MDRQGMEAFTYAKPIHTDDGLMTPYGGELVQAFVPASERPAVLERLPGLPALQISAAELLDMEMIACGALSPLTGFMTRAVYEGVLTNARLPDGRPWALPVTLAVTRAAALSIRSGQEVALYHGANPVGVMLVEEMFPWTRRRKTHSLGAASNDAPLLRARAPGGISGRWASGAARRAQAPALCSTDISGRRDAWSDYAARLASGGGSAHQASVAAYPRVPAQVRTRILGCPASAYAGQQGDSPTGNLVGDPADGQPHVD